MNTRRLLAFVAAFGLLGWLGGATQAQRSAPPPQPPVKHHGLFGHRPGGPMHGRPTMMTGRIIGNKRTHVYHLPGETGSLPAEKNRVYFMTEAQARAAGYRPAKQGLAKGRKRLDSSTGGSFRKHGPMRPKP